jgi:hypothetical protein
MYIVSQAIARARIFSARHGWLRWAVVVLLAVTAGLATHRQLAAVEAERAAWGDTVEVVVAARNLAPDEVIAVDTISVPTAMAPPAALAALPDGARLRQRVTAGEILTNADITAAPGPAASAAPGMAVVALIDPLARNVAVGLDVRITSEGVTLADGATIVSVMDDVVYVAMAERDAPMVAAAAQAGLASLIFLP